MVWFYHAWRTVSSDDFPTANVHVILNLNSHHRSPSSIHCMVNGNLLPLGAISGPSNQCNSCPPGFISCAGRCYQRLNLKVAFADAKNYCKLLHPKAHLAVPRTRQENICAAGLAGGKPVWLGISDIKHEGWFVGEDEKGVVDLFSSGHVWSKKQPDNAGNNEDCVEMWLGKDIDFAEWNDRPCNYKGNMPMCQLKM